MAVMMLPAFVIYLSAGAYIAIMIAVLGVPQLLSSYFDLRARRHQEERQEERRQEERRQDEERRREERQLEEERRREERRLEEERRRQDAEAAERRHQELIAALIAAISNSNNQGNGQAELIRALQRTIEELQAENDRLRQQNGGGDSPAAL